MRTDRKKVIFFLPSLVGGAEKMSINIAKMLDKCKYDVCFVIVGRNMHPIADLIPEDYPCALLRVYNIWDFAVCKLYRLLRKERPYAVFSSIMYLNVRVIMAAKSVGGIKVMIRNDNYLKMAPKYVRKLISKVYPKADHIIAQQQEMAEELRSILPATECLKVKVLQNPVDTSLIDKKIAKVSSPYPPDSSVNYVCVAYVTFRKGQDVLLKAFYELQKTRPNAKLYFVGGLSDKHYLQTLNDYIEEKGLESSVTFVGYSDNPYRWIKFANCLVLPSRIEGLPNALIEAQYLGVPVVATRSVPIIDRIINNGHNGYTVKSEDALALAGAMADAVGLKNVKMSYISASKEEFVELFL